MTEEITQRKVSYHRKPLDMDVEQWQLELRKQFAETQKFNVKNIGKHPVFSDFEVFNPKSEKTYKVSIRDNQHSFNFCNCPDFQINTLGTCKHIEFVLFKLRKNKKNQQYLEKKYKPAYASLSVKYGAERLIKLRKPDESPLHNNENLFFDKEGFLIPGMQSSLPGFINDVQALDSTFKVYPDVLDLIREFRDKEERQKKINQLFPQGIDSPIFHNLIRANLYPYQKEGVLRILEAGRVLLADEMGLGKTIQAIAATEVLSKHFGVMKVLIICPTSLKFQWKKEIEKFTDKQADVIEGLVHKRREQYEKKSFYKIISYGACRNDLDALNSWQPDLVIIDEAQKIKNWKTQTAKTVKSIKSEYAVVLTGTPLENRIDELHSIVEFIDKFKLGPLFKFLHNHQLLDESGKLSGYKNLREINKTLTDILIRRNKNEIIDQLPERVDKNYYVDMVPEQVKYHKEYWDIASMLVKKWISKGFLSEEERERLLMSLNCMRMVADSTYILDQKTNYGVKASEVCQLLADLLECEDNKIVVFSQWKRMFELIVTELEKLNVKFVYLNGDVPAVKRKQIIEQFQEDKSLRVFLSTDAGGVGVNLQRANILINVDIPWNPAVLDQRIARIYRLGQKNHVNVFNFITKNSIEHRIYYLLDFKRSVFAGVIEEEGKDTVMLESFLESVRALTEVDIDEPLPSEINRVKQYTGTNDNLANEVNERYLESIDIENDNDFQEQEEEHDELYEQELKYFSDKRKSIAMNNKSKPASPLFISLGKKLSGFVRRLLGKK